MKSGQRFISPVVMYHVVNFRQSKRLVPKKCPQGTIRTVTDDRQKIQQELKLMNNGGFIIEILRKHRNIIYPPDFF